MARSGAIVPLLVGGGIAAAVAYAMTREAKAKSLPGPTSKEDFEPLPPGALPEDTLAKYQQALTFPTDPAALLGLVQELEALDAHYEAAQVREVLGYPGGPLPPGALPDELLQAYQMALYQPESFSHAELLDLADDLDMAGATYEAEQIRNLAAGLHGVDVPLAPSPSPAGEGLPADVVPPPGGGFVPPETFLQQPDNLWSQLGDVIPAGFPQSLPTWTPDLPAQVAMPPDFQPQAPVAAPGGGTYTIQPGDTLWALAQRGSGDGTRWNELVALNADQYPTHPDWGLVLHPGDTIRVPSDFQL